jgi:hypothetical protein
MRRIGEAFDSKDWFNIGGIVFCHGVVASRQNL